MQRTLSQIGTQLAAVRDRIIDLAQIQRHHVVLDLNAGAGLLTWEAILQVPEGGVYACVHNSSEANALRELAATLPELMRPTVVTASITELPAVLASQAPGVQFDCIIGRNALMYVPDKVQAAQIFTKLTSKSGKLILAETVPRHTQRFYRLLEANWLDAQLYKRLVVAEEAIYTDHSDPLLNWDADDLRSTFESAGIAVKVMLERNSTQMYISSALLNRLFTANTKRQSYVDRFSQNLMPVLIPHIPHPQLSHSKETDIFST
ncbi:MAG: hypothetical protein MET45_29585 [Nostoc sp. LLA-1]|nr:hypothetical protein [Cyanocohniella sp. LLY]